MTNHMTNHNQTHQQPYKSEPSLDIEQIPTTSSPTTPSLVPKGITIGLAILALILSLAGYGFRIAFGADANEVLGHAMMFVPVFVIGIPLLFYLGGWVMNKLTGSNVQFRNAISLGLLSSCVTMLWLMGTYS